MPDAVEHCVGFHLPRTDSTNRPKVGAAASRTTGIQRSPGTWAFTQKPGSAREAGPQGASPAKAARPGWPGRFQPLARTRALCEQKNKIKGPLRGRLVQKPKVTSQCSAMLSLRLALQRRWQPEFQSLWRALLRGGTMTTRTAAEIYQPSLVLSPVSQFAPSYRKICVDSMDTMATQRSADPSQNLMCTYPHLPTRCDAASVRQRARPSPFPPLPAKTMTSGTHCEIPTHFPRTVKFQSYFTYMTV